MRSSNGISNLSATVCDYAAEACPSTNLYPDLICLLGIITFLTMFIHLNAHDRWQNKFLIAGLVGGTMTGAYMQLELEDIIFKTGSWAVIIALCCNRIANYMFADRDLVLQAHTRID